MNQEGKYYTPEMSEFYIGFECEKQFHIQFSSHTITMCDLLYLARDKWEDDGMKEDISMYRVKYLDADDIVSLGFELSEEIDPMFGKHIYYKQEERETNEMAEAYATWKLLHMQGKLMITEKSDGWFNNPERTLFYGAIKNKSELKKILTQLNIK